VEKIGRRSIQESGGKGTEKRGGMPARPGTLSRGRSHHHCGTTMAQKLDEDLLATFIFFFQQGNEPHQFPVSDQEAICSLFASRNSGGSPMM